MELTRVDPAYGLLPLVAIGPIVLVRAGIVVAFGLDALLADLVDVI